MRWLNEHGMAGVVIKGADDTMVSAFKQIQTAQQARQDTIDQAILAADSCTSEISRQGAAFDGGQHV